MFDFDRRSDTAAPRARILGIAIVLLGHLLLFPIHAQAQSLPDPSREQQLFQQRQEAQRRALSTQPDIRLETPSSQPAGRLAEEAPCFPIVAVQWLYLAQDTEQIAPQATQQAAPQTEAALSASPIADWLPWLDAALAGEQKNDAPTGRCIGIAGVRTLQERAQNALLQHGFVTSRVLAPPQNLSTGLLRLGILPGRIHTVRLAQPQTPRATLWNALPLQSGQILNVRDMEQGLENLKRIPTADANIRIEPAAASDAASALAQSDIVVDYQQRFPLRVNLGIDNSGTKQTGKYQASATLFYDNALTLNDVFYLNVGHDLGSPGSASAYGGHEGYGTHSYAMQYELPLGYWLLSLSGNQYRYHQTLAGATIPIVYSGTSASKELHLSRVVQRDAQGKTTVGLKAWQRSANNAINGTEVAVQRRVQAGWELSGERQQFLGQASLSARVAYKKGTGAFGALPAPEELFKEGTSRMGLVKTDVSLTMPLKLGTHPARWSSVWRAQHNTTRLTPLDLFSIGGRYTVRGFDGERQLAAERGWLWRNDLGLALGQSGQELYAGVDYGQVSGPSAANLLGRHLAGAVIGVRGAYAGLQYDVSVGAPISKPQHFVTPRSTVSFNLNWLF